MPLKKTKAQPKRPCVDQEEISSGIIDTDPFITSSSSSSQPYFWEETDPWHIRLKDSSYDDFIWSKQQTRDIILDFNTSGLLKGTKQPWWLMYNPVYWFVFTICWSALFIGKRIHSTFDQGGKVRLDESEVEHDARIVWIYPCNGIQVIIILFNIYYVASTTLSANTSFVTALFSLIASNAYLLSNMRLYSAMQRRLAWEVKVVIVTSILYVLCVTAMIAIGIFEIHWYTLQRSTSKVLLYGVQMLLVLFIISGLVTTVPRLWFEYDDFDHKASPRCGTIIPVVVLLLSTMIPTVFRILIVLFRIFLW